MEERSSTSSRRTPPVAPLRSVRLAGTTRPPSQARSKPTPFSPRRRRRRASRGAAGRGRHGNRRDAAQCTSRHRSGPSQRSPARRGDVSSLAVEPHRSCSAVILTPATSSPSSTRPSRPTEGHDHDRIVAAEGQTGTGSRRSQRALLGFGCVPHHRRGVRHEGRACIKAAMKATSAG